jgi:magnesium transporter
MDVHWLSAGVVERREPEDLEALLARDDGFVWVDVPRCDDDAAGVLTNVFRFHPLAVRDCLERTHVPKIHGYADHLFVILHAPEPGAAGHVHLLELDQFIGRRFLVTVHGPLGVGVPLEPALKETRSVLARIESARFKPSTPFELSYAIASAVSRRMEAYVKSMANSIAGLERRVVNDDLSKPEPLIERMFLLRHELVTIVTMASQSRDVYVRASGLGRTPPEGKPFVEDLRDQFDAVRSMGEGEERFLEGVVDFYQTRVSTELNQFAKRLTALGAILVIDTLIAGIYGMNFRHMPELDWRLGYPLALAIMVLVAIVLTWYFRRKHWL